MTSSDPQRDRAEAEQGRKDLKRTGLYLLLGLVALVVVLTITVALSNLGSDDDPSGGGTEGLGPAVGVELSLPAR